MLNVDGPAWADSGMIENPGIYPLRVENAVGRLVERLLPGIITTTTGARYFGLHALARADAARRDLNREDADDFVRRCEVVLAAVSLLHSDAHRRRIPDAHGESRIPYFSDEESVDLAGAAKLVTGMSKGGFAGTYEAPERTIGLLEGRDPPIPGNRMDLGPLMEGLGDVLILAKRDRVSWDELAGAIHLCPCQAAESSDGKWLRRTLFEEVRVDHSSDINRRTTGLMLLEALEAGPVTDVEAAFRIRHGFSPQDLSRDFETQTRRGWQAAILRNYSVSAWRDIWYWMSTLLCREELTASELAGRLATSLGQERVGEFIESIPDRIDSDGLVPLEERFRETGDRSPRASLRQLFLGAMRLKDIDDETRRGYVGTERKDLGPEWVLRQMEDHRSSSLSHLAHSLTQTLLDRARRVTYSKMELRPEGPYVPTRLREREGVMWMETEEANAEVSLRGSTLAQVMAALGALDRTDSGYVLTTLGRTMKDHISAMEPTPLRA